MPVSWACWFSSFPLSYSIWWCVLSSSRHQDRRIHVGSSSTLRISAWITHSRLRPHWFQCLAGCSLPPDLPFLCLESLIAPWAAYRMSPYLWRWWTPESMSRSSFRPDSSHFADGTWCSLSFRARYRILLLTWITHLSVFASLLRAWYALSLWFRLQLQIFWLSDWPLAWSGLHSSILFSPELPSSFSASWSCRLS